VVFIVLSFMLLLFHLLFSFSGKFATVMAILFFLLVCFLLHILIFCHFAYLHLFSSIRSFILAILLL